jgi:hypothetical protein
VTEITWQAMQCELRVASNGVDDLVYASVIGAVVHNYAFEVLVRLLLDGPDRVGHEARVVPIDDNDRYARLVCERIQSNTTACSTRLRSVGIIKLPSPYHIGQAMALA